MRYNSINYECYDCAAMGVKDSEIFEKSCREILDGGRYPIILLGFGEPEVISATPDPRNPVNALPVDFTGMPVKVRTDLLPDDEYDPDPRKPFSILGWRDEPGFEYKVPIYQYREVSYSCSYRGNSVRDTSRTLTIAVYDDTMLWATYTDGTPGRCGDHYAPRLMMTPEGFEIAPRGRGEYTPRFDWPVDPWISIVWNRARIEMYSQPYLLSGEDYDFLDRAWDMLRTK